MHQTRYLLALFLVFGVICHRASLQSFPIPDGGDSCNMVNLNFGSMDETTGRGPQGPPGKRGIPGIRGIRGRKGSKGAIGPIGTSPEINAAEIASTVMKALGATSCQELMRDHGMHEAGYYLMRSNNTKHPVYTYCDFQLRDGVESCQQLQRAMGRRMNSGFYLINDADNGRPNFLFCAKVPKDCMAVNRQDAIMLNDTGGVFDIYPVSEDRNIRVYCDLETDGGGWTVFQRRMDGSAEFYRTWNDYVNGFGERHGEFWLGLENLHEMTNAGDHELRIDLTDWSGNSAYAAYRTFLVGPRGDNFRLDVGGFTGTAPDRLGYHDKMQFSTRDADHDRDSSSCAQRYFGGWWYNDCHYSNLNGRYYRSRGTGSTGVVWDGRYTYLKFVEMKLRKKGRN